MGNERGKSMLHLKQFVAALALALAFLCMTGSAQAKGHGPGPAKAHPAHTHSSFAKHHPRRAQVVRRDKRLGSRTNNLERKKKITYQQATRLKGQEKTIRRQEQDYAHQQGGHITKAQQRVLNKEENAVKGEIKHDEKVDAAGHH